MDNKDIQHLLDNPDSLGIVELPEGEYEGRFFVNKSCTINGNSSLLCNSTGPVLVVDAENVKMNNLSIELTNSNLSPEHYISVFCRNKDTEFINTRVNGAVLGIENEEQFWGVPKIIDIGTFEAEKEHNYVVEIYSPVEAEISCNFHDVSLSCETLMQGYNTITIRIGKIRNGSVLYGSIVIKSVVERCIIFCGTAGDKNTFADGTMLFTVDRESPVQYSQMLKELDYVAISAMPAPEQETIMPSVQEEATVPEKIQAESLEDMYEDVLIAPGKRILIAQEQCKIELIGNYETEMDIDAYLFMLDNSGRVSNNSRMIFFGNDHSACGSVSYLNAPDKRAMYINFRRIPNDVNMMVMFFSIYGSDSQHLFDRLSDGEISILCENGVHMHLPLLNGIHCKTILALAFEKNDGIWEIIPSGKGVEIPLEEICHSYGVSVV